MNNSNSFKKLILIDLDGVLNEYHGDYKKGVISPPKQGTKLFLKKLSKKYEIKIFTTRNKFLTAKWIMENHFEDYISDITNVKENGTYLFIDDHCINFKGNYKNLELEIEKYKPYWKTNNQ